jgi:hypothetical protein
LIPIQQVHAAGEYRSLARRGRDDREVAKIAKNLCRGFFVIVAVVALIVTVSWRPVFMR